MSSARPFSVEQDCSLAMRMADIADAITLSRFQSLDLVIETKPDATPVTDADKAVERALRDILAAERPDDLIIGEEFGGLAELSDGDLDNRGAHYWVIDPIDGTKNFLRGIPIWATLIGLSTPAHTVVAGVVSAPALSRRWHAGEGLGAHVIENTALGRREKQIAVSKVSQLSDAQLAYSDLVGWGERLQPFLDVQKEVWRTRGFGDFWSHMLVAEGAVDIAIEPSLSLWDMAALEIIVNEAGGSFTNLTGKPGSHGGSLVSSNGTLHSAVIHALSGK